MSLFCVLLILSSGLNLLADEISSYKKILESVLWSEREEIEKESIHVLHPVLKERTYFLLEKVILKQEIGKSLLLYTLDQIKAGKTKDPWYFLSLAFYLNPTLSLDIEDKKKLKSLGPVFLRDSSRPQVQFGAAILRRKLFGGGKPADLRGKKGRFRGLELVREELLENEKKYILLEMKSSFSVNDFDTVYYLGKTLERLGILSSEARNFLSFMRKEQQNDRKLRIRNKVTFRQSTHLKKWYRSGLINFKEKKYEESMKAFEEALSVDPENKLIKGYVASLKGILKRLKEEKLRRERQILEKVLKEQEDIGKLDQVDSSLLTNQKVIVRLRRKISKAQDEEKKTVGPDSPFYDFVISAKKFLRTRTNSRALFVLRTLLPENEWVIKTYESLSKKGKEGIQILKKDRRKETSSFVTLDNKRRLYQLKIPYFWSRGEKGKTEGYITQLLAIDPLDRIARRFKGRLKDRISEDQKESRQLYQKGVWEFLSGRRNAAAGYFKEALRKNPYYFPAQTMVEYLREEKLKVESEKL